MRLIPAAAVTDCVRRLPPEAEAALRRAAREEPWPAAAGTLDELCRNLDAARETGLPICQDTGLVTVFAELGEGARVEDFEEAVQEGVRRGYAEGYLRKSVVRDPLRRGNTGDNTPAGIYLRLVPGESLRLTVAPKGAGSENMCAVRMLTPAEGEEGVRAFVLETLRRAGGKPCPPVVVGLGLGGSFDSVPRLAKEALLRPLGQPNGDEFYARLERELLEEIKSLGIGPQGLGGRTTALAVHIKPAPTHIAMLPAAVCLSCHALRHATEVI